jgi:hypothetical protein
VQSARYLFSCVTNERKLIDRARDSDYTGYDFWLTKLNRFNGNYVAAEMVKAFIVSSEYRQRFGP